MFALRRAVCDPKLLLMLCVQRNCPASSDPGGWFPPSLSSAHQGATCSLCRPSRRERFASSLSVVNPNRSCALVLQRAACNIREGTWARACWCSLQTETARKRIEELITKRPDAVGIRIGVKNRGCGGHSYVMNYVEEGDKDIKKDEVVRVNGINIYVANRALLTVLGTTVDWQEDDISAGFVFENPNAKSLCGCGESFAV